MQKVAMMGALMGSAAIGIALTPMERQHGRLMRAPDHTGDGPAWFYGPDGASDIFQPGDTIPSGWHDHPSKAGVTKPEPGAPDLNLARRSSKGTAASPAGNTGDTEPGELDVDGWPWDDTLHASSKSKTSKGLWRMKVGVGRPDPKAGYPKPAVPLDL